MKFSELDRAIGYIKETDLEYELVESVDGASFYIDVFFEDFAGRLTYWRSGRIVTELIDSHLNTIDHAEMVVQDEAQFLVVFTQFINNIR